MSGSQIKPLVLPGVTDKAKAVNKKITFLGVPNRGFIAELYGKAYSFREKIEQRINPPKEPDDKPVSAVKGDDDNMGGGAFEGLSDQQGFSKS